MESKLRLMIIGSGWSGKSSSGNTILGRPVFECGRARTLFCEVREGTVLGHSVTIVDVPGWNPISMVGTSESSKQDFKFSVSKCLPGPHVLLLVIPLDMAFNEVQGQYVQDYMGLLGDRAWRHVLILFTCGDYLDKMTTIEDHIRSEGAPLQKVLEKCDYRFQVFDNKNNTCPDQVPELLSKIERLVKSNSGGFYRADDEVLQRISDKRNLAKKKAAERQTENKIQRERLGQALKELEGQDSVTELQVVLLGTRNVGKSSTLNRILGEKVQELGKQTTSCRVYEGYMEQTPIKVVDTPGWWRRLHAKNTTEFLKQELKRSVFLCHPGPQVFLLVVDIVASFTDIHRQSVESHLQLLGDNVWQHMIVVFVRGDWLREETIEEHIELEGEALSLLVNKCGNRYHVMDNTSTDTSQVTELLQKMKELVVKNQRDFFRCDDRLIQEVEEKQRQLKQMTRQKTDEMWTQRQKVVRQPLSEIRLVLLGQKTVGKSASGNTILCQRCLPTCFNTKCHVATSDVDGRKIVVVDTPGWSKYRDQCTFEQDEEILRGVSLCPPGPHAVLLVLPVDIATTGRQQSALEEHMALFGSEVWKFTMVLFTYGDQLGDQTIEEHIMMEGSSLLQLVELCGNRYHVLNNKGESDSNQLQGLMEKIEEMVAVNGGQCFMPNTNDIHQRLEEKFERRAIGLHLEERWKKREEDMQGEFSDFLKELLRDLKGSQESGLQKTDPSIKSKLEKRRDTWKKPPSVVALIKQQKRSEEVEKKITARLNSLQEKQRRSKLRDPNQMKSSIEFLWPSMSGSNKSLSESSFKPEGKLKDVLGWLATLSLEEEENPPTLNYSMASSGFYSSISDSSLFTANTLGEGKST